MAVDWCDQNRPDPLVVATNPASSGPPQTGHFESGIPLTQQAATELGYLSFALVATEGGDSLSRPLRVEGKVGPHRAGYSAGVRSS
jgi:hypothetical protein